MKQLQKTVLILDLATELLEKGSWCGETHLQKATYLLEELLKVPLGFEFVLYKHGPYSFELRDELTEFLAYGFIELETQDRYGPRIKPTQAGEQLKGKFPKTIKIYHKRIEWLATRLGKSGVVDLEQIGTAFYVSRDNNLEDENQSKIADKIIELKPHIKKDEAESALKKVRELEQEAAKEFFA